MTMRLIYPSNHMNMKEIKNSKKARKAVGLLLLSLATFTAFYDYSETHIFNNNRTRSLTQEDVGIKGLQIVLPATIDTTPQRIMTELFSDPEAVIEDKHRKCKATSQVKISFDSKNSVMLSTFDEDGVEKKQGGDEFYITYSAASTTDGSSNIVAPDAVAHVKDLDNGRYILELVQPLLPFEVERLESDILSGGTFTVVLQYTCGLGSYMPPTKATWGHGGAINTKWYAKFPEGFLPPITMARDRPLPESFGKEMASYRAIYTIGDSLMHQFIGGTYQGEKMDTRRRDNLSYASMLGLPLKSSTLEIFVRKAKSLARDNGFEGNKGSDCALLLGSGVWDVLANNEDQQPNFDDHLEALRKYMLAVQEFTNAKIYWKSMTGLHIHSTNGANIIGSPGVERVRYLSASRAKMLHDAQIQLMEDLNIPVLDMYNFTYEAADQSLPGDGRHFNGELNERMMDFFYPIEKSINNVQLSEGKAAVEERFV